MKGFKIHFAWVKSFKIINAVGPTYQPNKTEQEWIAHVNKVKDNFYIKLEQSILKEGFKQPILINSGHCSTIWRRRLPREVLEPIHNKLVCDCWGGSRLYIAQKHKMKIPCIVLDYNGRFANFEELKTKDDILSKFKVLPRALKIEPHKVMVYP